MAQPINETSSRRHGRLQFSLLALLLVVTATCFLVAWLTQPNQCEALALFRVSASPPTLAQNRPQAFDSREFELLQNSHLEMIRSDIVLRAAVRNPGIANLTLLSARRDPAEWLAQNIRAVFLHDSEILSISLRGPASKAEEIRLIVDAVAKAYQDEVVYEERQQRLSERDVKARTLDELRDELEERMLKLDEMNQGEGETSGNVQAELLQMEVEVLKKAWRELAIQVESADIEASAPDRVLQIQPAIPRFD